MRAIQENLTKDELLVRHFRNGQKHEPAAHSEAYNTYESLSFVEYVSSTGVEVYQCGVEKRGKE